MKSKVFNLEFLVFLLIGIVWFYFSFFHGFDDDEFQHCHNAYLIWKGLVPYRDFFEHHLPLYHILFSIFYLAGEKPSTIFLFRFLSLVSSAFVFVIVYRFLKENHGFETALFSVLLLGFVPMFLFKMTEARPESIAVLLFTISTIFIFSQKSEIKQLFFAGILCGLMVCLSLKYIFAFSGLLVGCFVLKGKKGLSFLNGFFAGIFPLFLYVLIRGILPEFIDSTILMNLKWKYRFSPSGYLYETFITAGVLSGCAISGIILEFFVKKTKRKAAALFFLITGCFLGIVLVPVPYRQSFLPFLVICIFCASSFIKEFFQLVQNKNLRFAVAAIIFFCATSNSLTQIKGEFFQTNLAELNKMKKIDTLFPDTTFFDGRSFLFYRMHTGYYGFMHHELLQMLEQDEYSQHVIEAIKKNNFPLVIYDYRVSQMPAKIQDFIQSHYLIAMEPDIYVPGTTVDRSQFIDGKAEFEIDVSGWYKILFSGDEVLIDNKIVKPYSLMFFEKGTHTVESTTFIESLKIILEKR